MKKQCVFNKKLNTLCRGKHTKYILCPKHNKICQYINKNNLYEVFREMNDIEELIHFGAAISDGELKQKIIILYYLYKY